MTHLALTLATVAWLGAGAAVADHHDLPAGGGHDHGKPADKKSDGKKGAKSGSVTGTVVDLACQILGEKPDPGHKGCAEGGVPVGLVDAKGKLWMAIDANYGSATDELLPYMGKKIKATGWFVERKGERLISISTIEEVPELAGKGSAPKKAAESWICPHECGGTGTKAGACPACGLEMVRKKG